MSLQTSQRNQRRLPHSPNAFPRFDICLVNFRIERVSPATLCRGFTLRDVKLEAVEYAACLSDRRAVRAVRAFFELLGEEVKGV